jgi:hypothetical protein
LSAVYYSGPPPPSSSTHSQSTFKTLSGLPPYTAHPPAITPSPTIIHTDLTSAVPALVTGMRHLSAQAGSLQILRYHCHAAVSGMFSPVTPVPPVLHVQASSLYICNSGQCQQHSAFSSAACGNPSAAPVYTRYTLSNYKLMRAASYTLAHIHFQSRAILLLEKIFNVSHLLTCQPHSCICPDHGHLES